MTTETQRPHQFHPLVVAPSAHYQTTGPRYGNEPTVGSVMGWFTPPVNRRNRQHQEQLRQKSFEARYSTAAPSTVGSHGNKKNRQRDGCCGCCCCKDDGGGGQVGEQCWTCVLRFTKTLIVVQNCLFMMVGALLIAVGLCILFDSSYLLLVYRQLLSQAVSPLIALSNRQVLSWTFVGLGCAILLLSLLGCCGACVNNTCLLCLYSITLVILIGGEVVTCVLFGITQQQIQSQIERAARDQLQLLYRGTGAYRHSENGTESSDNLFSLSWDNTQLTLSCCGASGPDDYQRSVWLNSTRKHSSVDPMVTVSPSCCVIDNPFPVEKIFTSDSSMWNVTDCQREAFESLQVRGQEKSFHDVVERSSATSQLNTQGCTQSVLNLITHNAYILLGVVCGIILLQVVDVFLSYLLIHAIHKKESRQQAEPWDDDTDFY